VNQKSSALAPSNRREYERRINRVIDHVQAHLANDLTLERLAGVAVFSPFHFHRIFAAITGGTLSDFIRRIRLERAAGAPTLLPNTSVLEIALRYGFSSAAYVCASVQSAFRHERNAMTHRWRAAMEGGAQTSEQTRQIESQSGTSRTQESQGIGRTNPASSSMHMHLGVSEACQGQLDAAVGELNQTIDAGYRTFYAYAYLTGVEAAKGNDTAAKLALAEARRLNPQFTIKWFGEYNPGLPPAIIVNGWRKAGLPEE
jgi:AraC-like DNA-binding protein